MTGGSVQSWTGAAQGGDLCLASAPSDDGDPGGILPRPADALDVRLPAARAMPGPTHRPVPAVTLTCRLSAPGAGSLRPVTDGQVRPTP